MFTLSEILMLIEREALRHNNLTTVQYGILEEIANLTVPDVDPPLLFINYGVINNSSGRNVLTVTTHFATVVEDEDNLTAISSMLQTHDDVITLLKYSDEGCDMDINTSAAAGLLPNNFPRNWNGVTGTWTLAWDAPYNTDAIPLKPITP